MATSTVTIAATHVLPRMVAGASVGDTAAFATSPTAFPVTGITAVMTSPEWLAAGSDVETEEHMTGDAVDHKEQSGMQNSAGQSGTGE